MKIRISHVWTTHPSNTLACFPCTRRHDFVVVEVIEFYDDEDEELPPPLTLKDVITMNKVCKEGKMCEINHIVRGCVSLRDGVSSP